MQEHFDGYLLQRELGRGGFGVVYLAQQPALDRQVALKILLPEISHESGFVARFQREARVAASLRHPNVAQVYNASKFADQYYIAMEYIEGKNLRERLDEGFLPSYQETVELIGQLLQGLEQAHARSIIHRDIKPANILLEDASGRVVLTDFSIAHMTGCSRITATGQFLGTPEYLAPEILEGNSVTPATDLYAVGLLLYELLTGVHPFRSHRIHEVIKAQLSEVPKSPLRLNPHLPVELSNVVMQLLQKDSSRRPQSSAELGRLLKGAGQAPPIPKVSLAPPPILLKPSPLDLTPAQAPEVEPDAPQERALSGPKDPRQSSQLEPAAVAKVRPKSWGKTLFLGGLLLATVAASLWPSPSPHLPVESASVILQCRPETIQLRLNDRPPQSYRQGQRLRLGLGKVRLQAEAAGFRSQRAEFELGPGQLLRVIFLLEPESAEVTLEGQLEEVSLKLDAQSPRPAPPQLELAPGSHRLQLSRSGFLDQVFELQLSDRAQVICPVQLRPQPAIITLQSQPAGAMVWLNQVKQGTTPLKLEAPAGAVGLRLRHPGYQEASMKLQLRPGQHLDLEPQLLPLKKKAR